MMSLKKTQMKHIIENDIVKEVLKVFKGAKIIRVGDFTLEKKESIIKIIHINTLFILKIIILGYLEILHQQYY